MIETQASLFTRLDESISGLVGELTETASSLTGVAQRVEELLDEDNVGAIGGILSNVEEFTGNLTVISSDVSTVTTSLAQTSRDIPGLIDNAESMLAAFETSAGSIDSAGAEISLAAQGLDRSFASMSDDFNGLATDLQPLARGGATRLVDLVDELTLLAATIRRFAESIERDPTSIIFGRQNVVRGPGE